MEGAAIAVSDGSPTLVNCSFNNNDATVGNGGGMYDPTAGATVTNCIFWGNTSGRGNPEIGPDAGSTPNVTKSDVAGGFPGTGNIDADPLFAQGGMLQSTSPCKNKGQSSALPPDVADLDWDGNTTEKVTFDLFGGQRKVSFIVDMGAYEIPLGAGSQ